MDRACYTASHISYLVLFFFFFVFQDSREIILNKVNSYDVARKTEN